MPDKSIMALPDIHTDPAARQKAKEMLSDGQISVFYIEWSKPINPMNLDESFAGLNPGDAQPTLKELTALAIHRGIPVVPVDMPPDQVLATLDRNSPDYAPHSAASLIQPWGEAVRDEYTGRAIADDMRGRDNGTVALLMYGANHFNPKVDDGVVLAKPLDELIRGHGEADVYKLKLTYGQEQASSSQPMVDQDPSAKEQKKSGITM